jgi:broad specificity phosphatase PhoE
MVATGEEVSVSRLLEIRRHSKARSSEERGLGSALSQEGVRLARRLGDGLRPFDMVLTSDVPRAIETALAMGVAIDEIDDALAPHDPLFWPEAKEFAGDRTLSFAVWAEIVGHRASAWRHGERQRDRWLEVASQLPDEGSALIVCHGGTIEAGVVSCFGAEVWEVWDELSPCEGVQLTLDQTTFVSAVILRVDAAIAGSDEQR